MGKDPVRQGAGSCSSGSITSGPRSAVSAILSCPGVRRRQCGGKLLVQSGVSLISASSSSCLSAEATMGMPLRSEI